MTQCDEVRALLASCRDYLEHGEGRLVIDLRTITDADTKLAACLVAIFRLARASDVRIELMLSDVAWNVLTICRLNDVMATAQRQSSKTG